MIGSIARESCRGLQHLIENKIEEIIVQGPSEQVYQICDHALNYIRVNIQTVGDDIEDLETLRGQLKSILSLVGLLEHAVPGKQIKWVESLIYECYSMYGIKPGERFPIVIGVDMFDHFSVNPNALQLLPPDLGDLIQRKLNMPVDIFQKAS